MTDEQVTEYLRENGYPSHVVRGGSAGLIRRWKEFADEVARGYEFGLEDYRNDLDVRGILALIGAEAAVREADVQFREMLTATDVRVWESGEGNHWWDFGYPRNVMGQLRQDLASAGLLRQEG
jgi:hypothetical protein